MTQRCGEKVPARRAIAGTALCCAVLLTLSACGGGGGSEDASGSTVKYGYDLSAQFTNTFNVAKSTGDCDQVPFFMIYDSLMHWDGTKFSPGLAEKIETDATTATITLRDGVTFQDGQPFDAEAVKAGLLENKKNTQLDSLHKITSIDTPDAKTVVVHYKDDTIVDFVGAMSGRDGMIMAPGSYATADKKPVGAGPFRFASFTAGDSIVLEKNPDYWDKGAYDFDGITFEATGTGKDALTAVQAGGIDIARLESDLIDDAQRDGQLGVATRLSPAYLELQFRQSKAGNTPFDNVKVRQAMAMAIDKDKINASIQAGAGQVASQAFLEDSPAYDKSLKDRYPYDPVAARKLLTEAGYPNGFSFTMAIPGGGIQSMETQGALVQDMLKQIGITANITKILGSDIATNYYIKGGGDAFLAARLGSKSLTGSIDDLFSKYKFVSTWNNSGRQDITDLMTKAKTAPTPAERVRYVQEANRIVVDNALEIPIAFQPQGLAYTKAKIGGKVLAQTDICDPPDLSGLKVKG